VKRLGILVSQTFKNDSNFNVKNLTLCEKLYLVITNELSCYREKVLSFLVPNLQARVSTSNNLFIFDL
jgi:hypothetical protein